MTERLVQMTFDATAQRWEIVDVANASRAVLGLVDDAVRIGRDERGRVVEVVIDLDDPVNGLAPDDPTVGLVRREFGDEVAMRLTRHPGSTDVEERFVISAASTPALVTRTSASLADEPGVPVAQPDGTYRVPAKGATIRLIHERTGITITVTPKVDDGEWAVVCEADTGTLLAAGPLEDAGSDTSAVELTFGVALLPEELLVLVSGDPLEPVADQRQRRAGWARDLMRSAEHDVRLRPGRSARAAARAADVAAATGDTVLGERAADAIRRSNRWKWGRRGVVAALAAGAIAAGAVALSGSDRAEPSPGDPTYYETCDDARAAGPTPLRRGDPGYRIGLDRDGDGVACEG